MVGRVDLNMELWPRLAEMTVISPLSFGTTAKRPECDTEENVQDCFEGRIGKEETCCSSISRTDKETATVRIVATMEKGFFPVVRDLMVGRGCIENYTGVIHPLRFIFIYMSLQLGYVLI